MIDGISAGQNHTGSAMTQGPGGALGKDEFLKILVAQLRNQDPMSPMDGSEMAVQLAQFTSVEQLINLNATLEQQAGLQSALVNAMNSNAALSAIGQPVLAAGDQVVIPEEGTASVVFLVGEGGGAGTLRILDESGREVAKQELGGLPGGMHTIELEGAAAALPPGEYSYEVSVVGDDGSAVQTSTYTRAVVDGIRYTPEGPVLTAGGLLIPFGAIIEIGAGR